MTRYTPEMRERALRMLAEALPDHRGVVNEKVTVGVQAASCRAGLMVVSNSTGVNPPSRSWGRRWW